MNILTSIFTDDLAIDLGTVNTLIFAPERGVVLDEPSAVAIHKYTGEVLDVGAEAFKMLGREPKDVEIFRPVRGGNIENFDAVEKMLKAFITRVSGSSHRRSHVVIGVPGSSTTLEQRSVRDAARDAKATRVDLVDEGLCAALGAGLSYDDERAHLVVDVGGGTTNVAIVAGARRIIEESKRDVTADIYQTGLILTGGGALLGGMSERLQKELRLHVAAADDPLAAVALGAGRLLTDKARLQRAAIREDVPVWQAEQELVINW